MLRLPDQGRYRCFFFPTFISLCGQQLPGWDVRNGALSAAVAALRDLQLAGPDRLPLPLVLYGSGVAVHLPMNMVTVCFVVMPKCTNGIGAMPTVEFAYTFWWTNFGIKRFHQIFLDSFEGGGDNFFRVKCIPCEICKLRKYYSTPGGLLKEPGLG